MSLEIKCSLPQQFENKGSAYFFLLNDNREKIL